MPKDRQPSALRVSGGTVHANRFNSNTYAVCEFMLSSSMLVEGKARNLNLLTGFGTFNSTYRVRIRETFHHFYNSS